MQKIASKLLKKNCGIEFSVSINDKPAVNCLLDTGTSDLTISEKYIEHIGVSQGKKETIDATDGRLTISEIHISSLLINPLNRFFQPHIELKNLSATSADIQAMSQFLGVVCVVGYQELKNFKAFYDFAAGILYIKTNFITTKSSTKLQFFNS